MMNVKKKSDYQYEAMQISSETSEDIKAAIQFARGAMPVEAYDLTIAKKNNGIVIVDFRYGTMLVPFGGYIIKHQVEDGRTLFHGFNTKEDMDKIFEIIE